MRHDLVVEKYKAAYEKYKKKSNKAPQLDCN